MACRPLFAALTHSVGASGAGHSLPTKLQAMAEAGLRGVEIFQDDLDTYAASPEFAGIYQTLTPPSSPPHEGPHDARPVRTASTGAAVLPDLASEAPCTCWNAHGPCSYSTFYREWVCAAYVGRLCRGIGLAVLSLQPMRDVEGWKEEEDRQASFARVRSRFPIMRALGTDLLLICSNNQHAPATTGDVDVLARDLRALADEAAQYTEPGKTAAAQRAVPSLTDTRPLRIAFEGLSWGAHVDRWEQAYAVVKRAARGNLGLCLDSFNTLGREYADPCTRSGIQEPIQDTQRRLATSLEALATTVDPAHIFFLQIADARRPPSALPPSPCPGEARPSRMVWSRSHRLYPGESTRGAYLPVLAFVQAVQRCGYEGPWSVEVFHESLHDKDRGVPASHAQRAWAGLAWLEEQLCKEAV